jgi:hypothetical protein
MKFRSANLVNAAAAILVIAAAFALRGQTTAAAHGKEIKDRDIEWSDFKGEVDTTSPWDAYTGWTLAFRYDRPDFRGGRAYVNAKVQLFLTPNSWVRPDRKSDELLQHERGHYQIGEICRRKMETVINSTPFSQQNYQKEVLEAYSAVAAQCREFEEAYDRDTRHYRDREQQAIWSRTLADILKKQ